MQTSSTVCTGTGGRDEGRRSRKRRWRLLRDVRSTADGEGHRDALQFGEIAFFLGRERSLDERTAEKITWNQSKWRGKGRGGGGPLWRDWEKVLLSHWRWVAKYSVTQTATFEMTRLGQSATKLSHQRVRLKVQPGGKTLAHECRFISQLWPGVPSQAGSWIWECSLVGSQPVVMPTS